MSTISLISSHQPDVLDTVPTEIWTHIFQNIAHTPTAEDTATEWNSIRSGIMSASHTCNLWRDIALATPSLWSTIFLDFHSSESSPTNNVFLTILWIRRSQSTPLIIALFNIPEVHNDTSESRLSLLVIFSQMPRWKHALLTWTQTPTSPTFWSSRDSIMAPAPHLHTLILKETPCKTSIIDESTLPSGIWLRAPALRNLVAVTDLTDPTYTPPATDYISWGTSYNIPYHQLTHLHFAAHPKEMIHAGLVFHILHSAKNLISCSISGIIVHENPLQMLQLPNTSPILLLHHLRHLHLRSSIEAEREETSLSRMLTNITAPSLMTLTLSGDLAWDMESYKNFILRSTCALEELNLISTPILVSDSIACIKLSRSLKTVSFQNFTLDGEFLARWKEWDAREG